MKIFKTAEPPKPLTGAQKIKAAELAAELDQLQRTAAFDREREEFERDEWRRNAHEVTKVKTKTIKGRDRAAWVRRVTPYVPLVLVNATAMIFQFSWAQDHLTQFGITETSLARLVAAAMFAITAESIALVLQYHANRALQNGDSAAMLYLSAFTVAGLIASVNYSHYAIVVPGQPVPNPTPMAIVAAVCSLVSPWLWRIDARAKHRDQLREAGEIDARAVRLSLARKIFHPVRSIKVISRAAWTGETNPAKAVAQWESARAERGPRWYQRRTAQVPPTQSAPQIMTPKRQKDNRFRLANGEDYRQHPDYARGADIYRLSKAGPGRPLSQRDLAAKLGMKNRKLATKIIQDVNSATINNSVSATP